MLKRILFTVGLSALLAMPVFAVGQQGSTSPESGASSQMQRHQSAQHGQQVRGQQQIRQAQQRLKEAGFDPGPADGKMGPKTEKALRDFQESHGLQQTGRLDKETRDQLMAQAGEESQPHPSSSPRSNAGSSTGHAPGSTTPGTSTPGGPSSGR